MKEELEIILPTVSIAYIAGYFDGEGDAGVQHYRSSKNGRLYDRAIVRFSNTNRESLEWMRGELGCGSIHGDHPRHRRPLGKKVVYRYVIANAKAVAVMRGNAPVPDCKEGAR